MSRLSQAWESFVEMSFGGVELAPGQHNAMRQAFYAGGWAMLSMIVAAARLDEDPAHAVVEGLRDECLAFAEAVKQGRA